MTQPHGGDPDALRTWWDGLGDPLLTQLISMGQQAHPSVEAALARVKQARALAVGAGAGGKPEVQVRGQFGRQRFDEPLLSPGTATLLGGGLDARWELDLLGRQRATRVVAQTRVQGSEAGWHEARTLLAAEIAGAYLAVRACGEALDTRSLQLNSANLTQQLVSQRVVQGFDAPNSLAAAQTQVSEAQQALSAQQVDCNIALLPLASLTVSDEAALRAQLARSPWRSQAPRPVARVEPDPSMLAQRPDVALAEHALLAAAAEIGIAEADRWPRLLAELRLNSAQVQVGAVRSTLRPWSMGLDLLGPLLDWGARKAAVDAAKARHEEARAQWQLKASQALQELRTARLRLDAADQALVAAKGTEAVLGRAVQKSEMAFEVGTVNRLDVEATRREWLGQQLRVQTSRLELGQAWLAFYKAMGGGWQTGEPNHASTAGQQTAR